MSEVIAACWAAVMTGVAVYANIHVMRLCRKAFREGRAVQAKFGLLPSVKIERRHSNLYDEPGINTTSEQLVLPKG